MNEYQCGDCSEFFTPDEKYNDDPQKRKCLICGKGKGNIMYHGYKGLLPYIRGDNLGAGLMNPADGKMYDSKSAYYQAVKDAGCTIVGNDSPKVPKKYKADDVRPELRSAIREVLSKQKKRKSKWKTIN